MKAPSWRHLYPVVSLFTFASHAATLDVANADVPAAYVIAERGPHHRVWQKVTVESDENGKPMYRTNSAYTELETGMYVSQPDGSYVEASDEIEITATGGIAQKTRHQVTFAGNCNSPVAIDLLTADGKRLRSRILGLSYFDSSSGKSVLIAELKDSGGRLMATKNEVIYFDAFTDFKADVRYKNSKAGLEQDIILREMPTSPAKYGLSPATTHLEVLTEFINPPRPGKKVRIINGDVDEFLDFGDLQMGNGRVFALGDKSVEIPVTKQWGALEGRVFLVERIPFNTVEPQLRALPPARTASLKDSPDGVLHTVSAQRLLPPVKLAQKAGQPMELASAPVTGSGVVLDYITASSATNYTFQGDTTYYVSGTVNLSGTNTFFEGGTVIKYSPTNTARLNITSPIKWQASAYRPVVMTARDDSSVGETIGTNTLSGYYATTALYIDGATAGTNAILQNLRVAYATTAIAFNGSTGHVVSHAQLVNCANGFTATNTVFSLRNALFYNVLTNFNGSSSTGRCEHLTVDTAKWLNYSNRITLTMTNSLLVSVTNTGSFTSNSVSTGTASDFQTVGAASHYLTANSPYRNAGTTNINPTLQADLKRKTTYPPIVLTNNIAVGTTLSPQAQRDTDIPDRGYEYDPLDYVFSGRTITKILTLTNGVAIGTYGASGISGITISTAGNMVSEGSASALNRIVRYNTVQEQATTNWSASTAGNSIAISSSTGTQPRASFIFTAWSLLANNSYHISSNKRVRPFTFKDCQFGGGGFSFYGDGDAGFTNCLWERAKFYLEDWKLTANHDFYNNLFRGGLVNVNNYNGGAATLKDNLFDQTTIYQAGTVVHSNNAYVSGYSRLTPTNANDVVLTNAPIYLTSYLGKYFYPTNDGMLLSKHLQCWQPQCHQCRLVSLHHHDQSGQRGRFHGRYWFSLRGDYHQRCSDRHRYRRPCGLL